MKTPNRKPPDLPSVDDVAIPANRHGLLGQLFRLPELIWGSTPKPRSRLERYHAQAHYQPPDYQGDPD